MKRLVLIFAFVSAALSVTAGLDSLFYHPTQHIYTTPAKDGYAYEEISFLSADKTELTGWFIPAIGEAKGTVIHFHGNAQNMTAHYSFVSWLPRFGYSLFVFDYRGYGQSKGKPSRDGIYEDSVAAIKYIKSREDIDQSKLIVFGQSIGGANALAAVGANSFEGIVGVVTDSAFSTYKSVAGEHAGLLKPFAYTFIGNKHSPKKYVEHITPVPLLIIHGTKDNVASYKHAERLYDAAKEPKELWKIEGGGHTSALGPDLQTYGPKLLEKFNVWVGD